MAGSSPTLTHAYGDHPRQVADLHLPAGGAGGARGVVVLLHGGFWRARYDRSLQDDVVADLLAAGFVVWNVEYRPVGDGGGWPRTFADVADAVDALVDVDDAGGAPLPGRLLDRVVVVGHSAGGTLAAWAAARHLLPADATGAAARVRPVAACSQAGVLDLVAAARAGVGDGAVVDLMAVGPDDDPSRYAGTSPTALLPTGVPVLAVTGADDDTVPPEQSRAFVAAATAAGDDVRLVVVPGEGHYEHLQPGSGCWGAVRDWLDDVLPG